MSASENAHVVSANIIATSAKLKPPSERTWWKTT
jgi:hypothetical protein